MPPKVAGILVCTSDLVGRVITRGSHTLLPPHQVAEVTERALPLLHSPASMPRTESALGVQAEPSPDMSVTPVVAPHMPPSAKSLQRRLAAQTSAKKVAARSRSQLHRHGTGTAFPRPATNEKSGRSRSIRFVGGALIGMCLLAVAFGSIVSTLWGGDDNNVDASPTTSAAAATVTVATAATPASPHPQPRTCLRHQRSSSPQRARHLAVAGSWRPTGPATHPACCATTSRC